MEGQARLVVGRDAVLQLCPREPEASGALPSACPQADQGEPGRGQGGLLAKGPAGQVALATTVSDTQQSCPEMQTQESRAMGTTGWASELNTLGSAPRAWLGSKAAEARVIHVSPEGRKR